MSIDTIRLSIGTAIVLGLKKGALPVPPTTAYMMVGSECVNNCAFCTQARDAVGNADMLSRVIWPAFAEDEVLEALGRVEGTGLSRICLQCLIDPTAMSELPGTVKRLRTASELEVSVSISAVDNEMLSKLKEAGTDRIGIALDGASEQVFDRIKGKGVGNPYSWEGNWRSLGSALEIFGKGKVSTHIIVGIGETDRDIIDVLSRCREIGILASLFAYTPMKGTKDIGPPPELSRYRSMQIARALIMEKGETEGFRFDPSGKLTGLPLNRTEHDLDLGRVFMTRGCPDCNRPYYNERPRGPMYNYPRRLRSEEWERAFEEAMSYIEN
ncbi:MAG: radical SAM protein [Thermoplasmatota archaeon]